MHPILISECYQTKRGFPIVFFVLVTLTALFRYYDGDISIIVAIPILSMIIPSFVGVGTIFEEITKGIRKTIEDLWFGSLHSKKALQNFP